MSKPWKPGRKTVELKAAPRPSRIRRDPPAVRIQKAMNPYPSEREVWIVVVGVLLFALSFFVITLGFSDITSK